MSGTDRLRIACARPDRTADGVPPLTRKRLAVLAFASGAALGLTLLVFLRAVVRKLALACILAFVRRTVLVPKLARAFLRSLGLEPVRASDGNIPAPLIRQAGKIAAGFVPRTMRWLIPRCIPFSPHDLAVPE